MTMNVMERRAAFRKMHDTGCFILPNPWDVGGARRLQKLGYKALASTSAGMAWSMGRDDGEIEVDEVLAHLRMLVEACELPVNADFEAGFAATADGVAANVARCVDTGVSGLSIEDRNGKALYDRSEAIERLAAARSAIDGSGQDVVLVGRCEAFLLGETDLAALVERLRAYSDAGADCLYAPGIRTREQISEVVAAVRPKPVNVLLSFSQLAVPELADLGVRRISVGGALARATWARFEEVATHLMEVGTLTPRI